MVYYKYEIFRADGTRKAYVLKKQMGLERMRRIVGGNVECVGNLRGTMFFANEEGRLMGLDANRTFKYLVGNVFTERRITIK